MDFVKIDKKTGEHKKVRAKDIQDNILKIQGHIKWVNEEIEKTTTAMVGIDKSTSEGSMKFARLNSNLADLLTLLSTFQDQEEKQMVILKKYKDSKFFIPPRDWLIIGSLDLLGIFVIALDRESPKITKLASLILKVIPIRI